MLCALHVCKDENNDSEGRGRDVQAHQCSTCRREETECMGVGRRGARIQGEEMEARLCDVSGGRKGLYGYLVDPLVGTW